MKRRLTLPGRTRANQVRPMQEFQGKPDGSIDLYFSP